MGTVDNLQFFATSIPGVFATSEEAIEGLVTVKGQVGKSKHKVTREEGAPNPFLSYGQVSRDLLGVGVSLPGVFLAKNHVQDTVICNWTTSAGNLSIALEPAKGVEQRHNDDGGTAKTETTKESKQDDHIERNDHPRNKQVAGIEGERCGDGETGFTAIKKLQKPVATSKASEKSKLSIPPRTSGSKNDPTQTEPDQKPNTAVGKDPNETMKGFGLYIHGNKSSSVLGKLVIEKYESTERVRWWSGTSTKYENIVFNRKSHIQQSRFEKGWILRFVNCTIVRHLQSGGGYLQDAKIYVLYPAENGFVHGEYKGGKNPGWNQEHAQHNAEVWDEFLFILKKLVGESRFSKVEGNDFDTDPRLPQSVTVLPGVTPQPTLM